MSRRTGIDGRRQSTPLNNKKTKRKGAEKPFILDFGFNKRTTRKGADKPETQAKSERAAGAAGAESGTSETTVVQFRQQLVSLCIVALMVCIVAVMAVCLGLTGAIHFVGKVHSIKSRHSWLGKPGPLVGWAAEAGYYDSVVPGCASSFCCASFLLVRTANNALDALGVEKATQNADGTWTVRKPGPG
jgi:hypothetical protein